MLIKLTATLLIGCIGALLLSRTKMPAGYIVGAIIAVAIFNIATGSAVFPWYFKVFTQSIAGAFIAVPLTLEKIRALRTVVRPAVMIVLGMLAITICMAFVCTLVSPLSLMTALLASSPGGMSDTVLISADLGADPLQVSAVHSFRLLSVMSIFPAIDRKIVGYLEGKYPQKYADPEPAAERLEPLPGKKRRADVALSLLVSLGGGALGHALGIPAGSLIFGMASMCVFNIATGRGVIPMGLRRFAQICAGSLIGSNIGPENLQNAKHILLPILVIFFGNLVMNIVLGLFVARFSKLDLRTALFATIPAGVSDMALLADELNGDGPRVALLQTVRFVATIALFPQVYIWVVSLVNLL